MKYRIETKYAWYNKGSTLILVYYIENVPFTFDELEPGYLYDKDIVEQADKEKDYDITDVYTGSQYLILEKCHPCFDMIDIENKDELPDDLIPYFDEEDLRG